MKEKGWMMFSLPTLFKFNVVSEVKIDLGKQNYIIKNNGGTICFSISEGCWGSEKEGLQIKKKISLNVK